MVDVVTVLSVTCTGLKVIPDPKFESLTNPPVLEDPVVCVKVELPPPTPPNPKFVKLSVVV